MSVTDNRGDFLSYKGRLGVNPNARFVIISDMGQTVQWPICAYILICRNCQNILLTRFMPSTSVSTSSLVL